MRTNRIRWPGGGCAAGVLTGERERDGVGSGGGAAATGAAAAAVPPTERSRGAVRGMGSSGSERASNSIASSLRSPTRNRSRGWSCFGIRTSPSASLTQYPPTRPPLSSTLTGTPGTAAPVF